MVTLRANIPFHEHAGVVGYPHLSAHGPLATDAAGKFTLPNLVVGTSYSLEISARGYATRDAHFHVDPDVDPVLSDLMLWANKLALHGVVLDQAGKPVEGLQVKLIPNNEALATPGHRWLETKKDGRFQFHHLAKGDYRLIATLWKKTGDDKNGRPIHKMEANTELRVEPSDKDIRVILHIP